MKLFNNRARKRKLSNPNCTPPLKCNIRYLDRLGLEEKIASQRKEIRREIRDNARECPWRKIVWILQKFLNRSIQMMYHIKCKFCGRCKESSYSHNLREVTAGIQGIRYFTVLLSILYESLRFFEAFVNIQDYINM